MPSLKLELLPSKRFASNSLKTILHLKIRLTAVKIEPKETKPRPLLNLSVVIDRSGSMAGKKLEYTKKASELIVDNLTSDDILSVIAYDDEVKTISEPSPVTNKQLIKSQINNLTAGATTNLSGGLFQGYEQVTKFKKHEKLNKIFLLSDGLANVGITDNELLFKKAKDFSKEKVTIATFGVGDDFNEDLMTGIAVNSGAEYYYISDIEQIPDIITTELKGILLTAAQNVKVNVKKITGGKIIHTYGFLDFGDLRSEDQKWAILELELDPNSGNDKEIVTLELTYFDALADLDQIKEIYKLEVSFTDNSRLLDKTDDIVKRDVVKMKAAEVREKVTSFADSGNFAEAQEALSAQMMLYDKLEMDEDMEEEVESLKQVQKRMEKRQHSKADRKAMLFKAYEMKKQRKK